MPCAHPAVDSLDGKVEAAAALPGENVRERERESG